MCVYQRKTDHISGTMKDRGLGLIDH